MADAAARVRQARHRLAHPPPLGRGEPLGAIAGGGAHPDCPPALRRLAYFVCCAYRRAVRAMGGLRAVVLARRLGLHSALPAPSQWLPDPELAEIARPIHLRFADALLADPRWVPPRPLLRALMALHALCGGRARISRSMEPA